MDVADHQPTAPIINDDDEQPIVAIATPPSENLLRQLVGQYQEEFKMEYDNMREMFHERTNDIKRTIAQSRELLKKVEGDPAKQVELAVILPLKKLSTVNLMEMQIMPNFAWLSIMMFGYWIGQNAISFLLAPVLSLFLNNIQTLALTLIIPVVAYRHIIYEFDMRSRFNLLIFATIQGIISGYLFANYHLHLPLPFIVPLSISATAYLLGKNADSSRIMFLSISLGTGFLLNCMLGWIVAGLGFSYLLVSLVNTLSALLILQYYMESWDLDYTKDPYTYMFAYLYTNVTIEVLMFILAGSTG